MSNLLEDMTRLFAPMGVSPEIIQALAGADRATLDRMAAASAQEMRQDLRRMARDAGHFSVSDWVRSIQLKEVRRPRWWGKAEQLPSAAPTPISYTHVPLSHAFRTPHNVYTTPGRP
jgi:hypothetical protein